MSTSLSKCGGMLLLSQLLRRAEAGGLLEPVSFGIIVISCLGILRVKMLYSPVPYSGKAQYTCLF